MIQPEPLGCSPNDEKRFFDYIHSITKNPKLGLRQIPEMESESQ